MTKFREKLLRFSPWIPSVLFGAWIFSQLISDGLKIKWLIFWISLSLSAIGFIWLFVQIRIQKNPFPSFIAGLIDMAAIRPVAPPIMLLTGFLLLNHFTNLIVENDSLALFTCIFMILLIIETAWLIDLHTPKLSPPSEPIPTPGLLVFAGRLWDDKLLFQAQNCPDNPTIWLCSLKYAERLYQEIAEEFKQQNKIFTLKEISDEVVRRLKEKIPQLTDNERQVWECMATVAGTPIFAALRAVAYHSQSLRYMWIIVSKEAETFFKILEILIKKVFPKVKCYKIELEDANDITAIQAVVNKAYQDAKNLGLSEDQVTTDITGGSAIMSVGGALACVRSRRRLQYLRQDNFQFIAIPVTIANLKEAIDELLEQLPLILKNQSQTFTQR